MDTEILMLLGSIMIQAIGIYTQQNLTKYRIQQLEHKVNKHNNIVERPFKLEGRMNNSEENIEELKR